MSASHNSDYRYTVGGSLQDSDPTYVERKADLKFCEKLEQGIYCYVLNSRQMGKSSLRVRTMKTLKAKKFVCASIEMRDICSHRVTQNEFYGGIISRLRNEFCLEVDDGKWWHDHKYLAPYQRLVVFFEKVLLEKISNNIVIFIEEIDSIINLEFRDDFFAFIRSCHNTRADNHKYKRLTFALLGVATPDDLIEDQLRSPFNIKSEFIELTGFELSKTIPLQTGLKGKVSDPNTVMTQVLNWTGGQPFLTQYLCKLIHDNDSLISANKEKQCVEEIVQKQIIDKWLVQDDDINQQHLKTIRDRIIRDKTGGLLRLYEKIFQFEEIKADKSREQIDLRLSGLVVQQQGKLKVYNYLYKCIFNQTWIDNTLTECGTEEKEEAEISQSKALVKIEPPNRLSSPTTKLPAKNPQHKENMPNYLENLHRYKEYGESILQGLNLIPQPESWPDGVPANLHNCIKSLRDAANTTIERATSPIKIAIMGEVSSGKTLLVGSLIGYADGLPVGETSTTGNVTAIHVVQQESFQTTKLDKFTVEYLSEEEVKKCLCYMLREAENRAKAAKLSSELIKSLQSLSPQNAVDCNSILKWCQQSWESAQNSELRYLLHEIVVFVNTYMVYGAIKDFCGSTKKIDDTTIKNGLKLDPLPENILELTFDQLPPAPMQWQNIDQPSPEELHHSFSLIRCIHVTVEVSKRIWDLSSLKGTNDNNEFVLLDIPGLGSEHSGVRDTFLSLMEIEEVSTFLLLLNAKNPVSQTAAKIRTMIEQHKKKGDLRDCILVGVGRFNQLPLSFSNKQKIRELLEMSLLSEEDVLNGLDILKQIITSAKNLTTEKDRIILLSQLFGLEKLAQESDLVRVGSLEFLPELEQVKKPDESTMREQWKQLSDMLPSVQNSTLGRQLSDFVDDGGLGKLRLLLQTHVATHGIKQLHEHTRRAVEDLREAQKTLEKIVDQIQDDRIESVESSAITKLSQTIETLLTTYRDLQNNLRKKPLLNRNGVAVSDVVKKELSFRINNWNEWGLLFNKIQNGIINIPSTSTYVDSNLIDIYDDFGYPVTPNDNNSILMNSDDFYSIFKTTLEELKEFALTSIEEAYKNLLNELSSDLEQERSNISQILSDNIIQQIKQNFGDDKANLVISLKRSADPSQLQEGIIINIKRIIDSSSTINSEIPFPLARVDDKHNIGQIFDWSPNKKMPVPPRPFNHEFLLLRLRSEMIASASLNLVQIVSVVTRGVIIKLLEVVDQRIINSLERILKQEALLKYIAVEDQQLQTNNPQFLKILFSISSISDPED